MADKFRKTVPLQISYAAAEQPTHRKLNVANAQVRAGTGLLEKAIGDLWSQSGDAHLYTMSERQLQTPNLGRAIGEFAFIGPVMSTFPRDIFNYVEDLYLTHFGQTTGFLKFPPSVAPYILTQLDGAGVFVTKQTDEIDVVADGDYWVDENTGRFRCFKKIGDGSGTAQISYVVNSVPWFEKYVDLTANVIPNANQDGFTSCLIINNGGSFTLHLASRRPITNWEISSQDRPAIYPSVITGNESLVIGDYKLWQSKSVDALADAFYYYALPSLFPATATVPDGLIYLYDQTNRTIIEGITFETTAVPYVLNLTTTTQTAFLTARAVSPGNLSESDFNGCNVSLIVCGSSLAKRAYTQAAEFMTHSHDRSNANIEAPVISHNSLDDQNPPTNVGSLNNDYPATIPPWRASGWTNDPHTHLLSRVGAQGSGEERDWINNAMVGDFLLANNDPDNYIDATTPDGSFAIKFGDVAGGGAIYTDTDGSLKIDTHGSVNARFDTNPDYGSISLYVDGTVRSSIASDLSFDVTRISTTLNQFDFHTSAQARITLNDTTLFPVSGQTIDLGTTSLPFDTTYTKKAGTGSNIPFELIQNDQVCWEVGTNGSFRPLSNLNIGGSETGQRVGYYYGKQIDLTAEVPNQQDAIMTLGGNGSTGTSGKGGYFIGGSGVSGNYPGGSGVFGQGGNASGIGSGGNGVVGKGGSTSNNHGHGGLFMGSGVTETIGANNMSCGIVAGSDGSSTGAVFINTGLGLALSSSGRGYFACDTTYNNSSNPVLKIDSAMNQSGLKIEGVTPNTEVDRRGLLYLDAKHYNAGTNDEYIEPHMRVSLLPIAISVEIQADEIARLPVGAVFFTQALDGGPVTLCVIALDGGTKKIAWVDLPLLS